MAAQKVVHPKIIRPFRVIVVQEEEWLSARVLEYNLAAQARTLDGLYVELERVVLGHVAARREHGQEPFEDMPRAPKKYWDMFERSKVPLPVQKFPIDIKKPAPLRIDRPEVRVAATR
jgi:hypothetical protein